MNHDSKPVHALLSLLFQVAGEQLFADVAKDILLYVSRDLSDKVNRLQPFEDFHGNVRVCACVWFFACYGCVFFTDGEDKKGMLHARWPFKAEQYNPQFVRSRHLYKPKHYKFHQKMCRVYTCISVSSHILEAKRRDPVDKLPLKPPAPLRVGPFFFPFW